jgi:hypothetical protein
MDKITQKELVSIQNIFKKYIEEMPVDILGPLIIINPGEEWRMIVLNEMIQKKVIVLSQEMMEQMKIYSEKKTAFDVLKTMCADYFNDTKNDYFSFKDYWRKNQDITQSNTQCPTRLEISSILRENEFDAMRAEKLKHMSVEDFVLLKMIVLT